MIVKIWSNYIYIFFFEDCQDDLLFNESYIYILSDDTTSFLEAEQSCRSKGGQLAQIETNNRNFFEEKLRNKYISEC